MKNSPEAARYSALARHRSSDDPALADAHRDLVAHQLAEIIREKARTAPPLTDGQRARLAALILTVAAP